MEEKTADNNKLKQFFKNNIKKIIIFIIVIIAVTGFIIVSRILKFDIYVTNAYKFGLNWINSLGIIGPIFFIIIYIFSAVFFISGAVLTMGAGVLFGILWGTLYVSIGSTLGAAAAFLIGRYFARKWVEKKIQGNKKFEAIDDAVAKEGWKIVLLTRLSPVFPFVLLNYVYGLTKVKFLHYFAASWIGMLPGTLLYVYLGFLIGDIAELGTGNSGKTLLEWIFTIGGLIITILVTIYVTYIAKRALNKKIDIKESL